MHFSVEVERFANSVDERNETFTLIVLLVKVWKQKANRSLRHRNWLLPKEFFKYQQRRHAFKLVLVNISTHEYAHAQWTTYRFLLEMGGFSCRPLVTWPFQQVCSCLVRDERPLSSGAGAENFGIIQNRKLWFVWIAACTRTVFWLSMESNTASRNCSV